MKYFAYGSNMSLARLRQRLPGARAGQMWCLPAYDLRFHKLGSDGSAKCDAFATGRSDDHVFGIVYELSARQLQLLDGIEGLGQGYARAEVGLIHESGSTIEALTYVATHIDTSSKPFDWYLRHVLVGARESRLPDHYISRLEAVQTIADHDQERAARQRAIHARSDLALIS